MNQPRWYTNKAIMLFFHVAAWLVVFSLPYLFRPSFENIPGHTERRHNFEGFIILLNCLFVVIFYLNAYLLIPRLLYQKKIALYIISLVILLDLVVLGVYFSGKIFMPKEILEIEESPNMMIGPPRMPIFLPVLTFLFILASSTAYRFIIDKVRTDRLQQEKKNENLTSELLFLRSQVSPHFMFNVLNSIVSLARVKSDKLEPVVIKLSHLLRYMLYESDEQKVSLQKEIQYLESYIDLQKMRFDDRVEIKVDIDRSIDSYLIEPMLLIPFIENAFKHGVDLIMNPAITVKLSEANAVLHFDVRNKFNDSQQEEKDKHAGIGLSNVRRRLNLLYGEKHTLIIDRKQDWFIVQLTLRLK